MRIRLGLRRLALALLVLGSSLGLTILHAQRSVAAWAPLVYEEIDELPPGGVGLVLGCSPTVSGLPNAFYRNRIEATLRLFRAGRISHILVSGDNGRRSYNEPDTMKADLIARGVPTDRIHCDYAGFSTLDSVVRAKEVFGLERCIVISQRFQCERAIYIARARGLDAIGYAAADVQGLLGTRTYAREYLARVKAWIDIRVTGRGPHFLGPRVTIPADV